MVILLTHITKLLQNSTFSYHVLLLPIMRSLFPNRSEPRFHTKESEIVKIHAVTFRLCFWPSEAKQRRPFPSTETAEIYKEQGGQTKKPTTLEFREPEIDKVSSFLCFIGKIL